MAYRLKRDVRVADETGAMVTLEAGTKLSEVSARAKEQLAPEHFTDDVGGIPSDWRPPAAQQRDDQQRAFLDEYIRTHVQPREV